MKLNIFIVLAYLALSFTPVQSNQSQFIQFKINTISSNDQAMLIDHKMRLKSGIQITRTDYLTSTFFCVLKPQMKYSKEDFTKWFNKLGYTISCYNTGIHRKDKVISPYTLKKCQDEK